MDVAQLEGRLGRGDVDHHHLVQMVLRPEGVQIGPDALDGGTRRLSTLGFGQVGQPGDGAAGVQDGAGPDVFRPLVQRRAGMPAMTLGIEDVGPLVEFARQPGA